MLTNYNTEKFAFYSMKAILILKQLVFSSNANLVLSHLGVPANCVLESHANFGVPSNSLHCTNHTD